METESSCGSSLTTDATPGAIKLEEGEEEDFEKSSSSISFGSDDEPCLICLNSSSSKSVGVGGGGGDDHEQVEVVDMDCWWKQFQRPGEPSSLSRSVSWIFVLRHLLHFPEEQVAALLSSTGVGPGSWCDLCGACSRLASAALSYHKEVMELQAKIGVIGGQLKTELGKSLESAVGHSGRGRNDDDHLLGDDEGVCSVRKIIREFYEGTLPSICKINEGVPLLDVVQQTTKKGQHQQRDSDNANISDGGDPYLGATTDDDIDDEDENVNEETDKDPLYAPSHHYDDDDAADVLPQRTRSSRSRSSRVPVSAGIPMKSSRKSESSSDTKSSKKRRRNKVTSRTTRDRSKAKHKCNVCDFACGQLRELKRHLKIHSTTQKTEFTCPICQHATPTHKARIRHMFRLHPKARLNCSKCEFTTDSCSTYYKHEDGHKIRDSLEPAAESGSGGGREEQELLRCKFCDTSGPWAKMYRHMKSKHLPQLGIESFSCTQCEFVVFTQDELKRHCARMHGTTPTGDEPVTRLKKWKCQACPSKFYSKYDLSCHVKSLHLSGPSSDSVKEQELSSSSSSTSSVECKVCGLRLRHRAGLLSHSRATHPAELVKCELCGKGFLSQAFLDKHIKLKHDETAKAASSCQYCGKVLRGGQGYLATHLRVWCRANPDFTTPEVVPRRKERKLLQKKVAHHHRRPRSLYQCGKCDYKTTCQYLLEGHIQNHFIAEFFEDHHEEDERGRKQSRCKLCGEIWRHKERYRHLNGKHDSVLGVQFYQCHTCGKGFNKATSFRKHGKTHAPPARTKRNVPKERKKRDSTRRETRKKGVKEKSMCETCGTSFVFRFDMLKHQKKFHSGGSLVESDNNAPFRDDVQKKCKWCGLVLLHHKMLALHLREVHPEIYKYKCDLCDASFQRSYPLSCHKAGVHLNKTWTCQYYHREIKQSTTKSSHTSSCKKKRFQPKPPSPPK